MDGRLDPPLAELDLVSLQCRREIDVANPPVEGYL
jgi:hypothetical protein